MSFPFKIFSFAVFCQSGCYITFLGFIQYFQWEKKKKNDCSLNICSEKKEDPADFQDINVFIKYFHCIMQVKRPCINVRVSLRLYKPYEIASVHFAMKLSGLIGGPWRRAIKTSPHQERRLTRRISKVFWTPRGSHHRQSCECISLFLWVALQSVCALLSYWDFLLCQRWKQRWNISFTWMIHHFLLYLATLLQTLLFFSFFFCKLKFATGRLTSHHLSGLIGPLSLSTAPHP